MSFYYTSKGRLDLKELDEDARIFVASKVEEFLSSDWQTPLYRDSDTVVMVEDPRLRAENIFRLKAKKERGVKDYRVFFKGQPGVAMIFLIVHRDEAYSDEMFKEANKRLI